jgi:hypothetical protein
LAHANAAGELSSRDAGCIAKLAQLRPELHALGRGFSPSGWL